MIITTPENIDQPLYEGRFILQIDAKDAVVKGNEIKLTERQIRELDTPSVTLGKPEWWNLSTLVRERDNHLPAELGLQLRDSEFFLVRCACSFRPGLRSEVDWARLSLNLWVKNSIIQPIAFDIFPREIYNETQADTTIKVSPSLKFSGLELGLGETLITIKYTKIDPIIVGTGVQESDPSWDFEKFRGKGIRGSKIVYLIVKRPKTTPAVRIRLGIVAKIKTRYGVFPTKMRGLHDNLTLSICTE